MTIKNSKRDYLVIWIEHDLKYTRWYYKERDAVNMAFALVHKDGIPEVDVQVVKVRNYDE